jgi:hypothetical protein
MVGVAEKDACGHRSKISLSADGYSPTLDFNGAYIAAIESELATLSQSRKGGLVVPQGFDHVLYGASHRHRGP